MVEHSNHNSSSVNNLEGSSLLRRRVTGFFFVAVIFQLVALVIEHIDNALILEDGTVSWRNADRTRKTNKKSQKRYIFTNSETWLAGPRLGNNANGTSLTLDVIHDLIINANPGDTIIHGERSFSGSIPILKRTICTENSKFMQWEDPLQAAKNLTPYKDTVELKMLAFRLFYLAIHEHQNRPAREEAKARFSCAEDNYGRGLTIPYSKPSPPEIDQNISATTITPNTNIVGDFDFECPDAKFIAATIKTEGMGASVRYGALSALRLGMMTGRVVIFPTKWGMASCNRHDFQCFFMPPSPCVITEAELAQAPTVAKNDLL